MNPLKADFKLQKVDLYFLEGKIIDPRTGESYSNALIQQVFYGNRQNELISNVLEKYFRLLKPIFQDQIKLAANKTYEELSIKQK